MAFAIIMFAGLMGVVAMIAIGREDGVFAHGNMARLPKHPTSPLDEAERILTSRYAKGEITADEFMRMQAILRR